MQDCNNIQYDNELNERRENSSEKPTAEKTSNKAEN